MFMSENQSNQGQWSSKWTFILAATGAAVGLGNIWKFPYITGENGGGAFVLVYLICVLIVGVPLLMAEIFIGRQGQKNPAHAMSSLAVKCHRSRLWGLVGFLGILSSILILSYYSVISGWTIDYIFQAGAGDFHLQTVQHIDMLFKNLVANPGKLIFWHSLVMVLIVLVVIRGVEKGLEKAVVFMFPAMLALMLIMLGYSMSSGAFLQGLKFLFYPDFSKLHTGSALNALGHAFFTLSLATGSIMMYGAYLPKKISITGSAVAIMIADTGIALISGLVIFPIVFANNLTPSAGPGLIFQTLPIAFSHMPYGTFFATLFFIMLFFAAFTSAISLLEPSVSWIMEFFKLSRAKAVCIAGFVIWLLGLGTVFSFNIGANIKLFGLNMFEMFDYLTANFMLPVGGFFIAIFAAWFVSKKIINSELGQNRKVLIWLWQSSLRYLTPLIIVILFLSFIGIIKIG